MCNYNNKKKKQRKNRKPHLGHQPAKSRKRKMNYKNNYKKTKYKPMKRKVIFICKKINKFFLTIRPKAKLSAMGQNYNRSLS